MEGSHPVPQRVVPLRLATAELQRATSDVIRAMAVDALAAGVGSRLPIGSHYQNRFQVGAGTVQRAIELLTGTGALVLTSRGHLGRHIADMRIDRLWHIADIDPVRVLLPPRGPFEVRALLGVLSGEFTRLGVPSRIHHSAGAAERIRRLDAGDADITTVSSGFHDAVVATSGPARPTRRLAEHSYYARDTMLVLRRAADPATPAQPLRVAIDPASWDQARLTECEFPLDDGFTYVEVSFPRVPVAILEGRVDAGVWHAMQTLIPPRLAGLHQRPLERPAALELLARSSAAVLIMSERRPELRAVLDRLDLDRVAEAQTRLTSLPDDSPELLDPTWTV